MARCVEAEKAYGAAAFEVMNQRVMLQNLTTQCMTLEAQVQQATNDKYVAERERDNQAALRRAGAARLSQQMTMDNKV